MREPGNSSGGGKHGSNNYGVAMNLVSLFFRDKSDDGNGCSLFFIIN